MTGMDGAVVILGLEPAVHLEVFHELISRNDNMTEMSDPGSS